MKSEFYVEYRGEQACEKDLIAKIKEAWVAEGHLVKEIKDLKLYAKPEDPHFPPFFAHPDHPKC